MLFTPRGGYRRRVAQRPLVEAIEPRLLLNAYTVTNLNDSGPGSIRAALYQSNENPGDDTISFAAGLSGTITLTSGQLEISDTTGQTGILGPGVDALAVSANHLSRVFQVDSGVPATISGLTVTEGEVSGDNGGGIRSSGALTLSDDTFYRYWCGIR